MNEHAAELLALGALWGLAVGGSVVAGIAFRAVDELKAELEGFRDGYRYWRAVALGREGDADD